MCTKLRAHHWQKFAIFIRMIFFTANIGNRCCGQNIGFQQVSGFFLIICVFNHLSLGKISNHGFPIRPMKLHTQFSKNLQILFTDEVAGTVGNRRCGQIIGFVQICFFFLCMWQTWRTWQDCPSGPLKCTYNSAKICNIFMGNFTANVVSYVTGKLSVLRRFENFSAKWWKTCDSNGAPDKIAKIPNANAPPKLLFNSSIMKEKQDHVICFDDHISFRASLIPKSNSRIPSLSIPQRLNVAMPWNNHAQSIRLFRVVKQLFPAK